MLTDQLEHLETDTVSLWVPVGSTQDPVGQAGTAHFLEHLLFKGTETRSARRLAEEIEAVGGYLNAFTEPELTCYQARVPDRHLGLALELIFDMVRHPLLQAADFAKEQRVILEEILQAADEPEERVTELLAGAAFGEHPLGRTIAGSAAEVAALQVEDLRGFYRRHYQLGTMVLTVVGPRSAPDIQELLAGVLGAPPSVVPAAPARLPASFHRGQRFERRRTEGVHLALASPGFGLAHPSRPAVEVLNVILGGAQSSRLFQRLREEEALVYSVASETISYLDLGLVTVFLTLEPRALGRAIRILQEEFERLRREPLPLAEVERAQEQLKGSLTLALEDPLARSDFLGRELLWRGQVITPGDLRRDWEAVTPQELERLAAAVLPGEPPAIAGVGPLKGGITW